MWNGHHNGGPDDAGDSDPDNHSLLAASALAAYATGSVVDPNAGYGYDPSYGQFPQTLYQSQAVEALRRQEELRHQEQMRQQALAALQQQQQALHQHQGLHEMEYVRLLQQQQRAAELSAQRQRQEGLATRQNVEMVGRQQQRNELERRETERREAERRDAELRIQHDRASHDAYGDSEDDDEEDEEEEEDPPSNQVVENVPLLPARGKPEAVANALAAMRSRPSNEDEEAVVTAVPLADDLYEVHAEVEVAPIAEEAPKKKKKTKPPSSLPKKKVSPPSSSTLDDPVPDITESEYENVEALMVQFCRVPLLAEFSRPVSLLHPDLMGVYSKIVSHPMDLGRVCRAIRRRQYKNTRAIRLDMWRIFANCIKYHTHPSNKDGAVPAFVSIALHLRDYFNALWQEYMMPSEPTASGGGKQPRGASAASQRSAFEKREEDRKKRLMATATTIVSSRCLEKTAATILRFIELGGRVDRLDKGGLFREAAEDDDGDSEVVIANLQQLQKRLATLATVSQSDQEYAVAELQRDVTRCCSVDLFESRPSLRMRISHRIDRMLGQAVVPIFEANSRGVNQSSIWGCMAAAIWARESSKKPFWPALVLGIMAPEDQKEDWHMSLTERNERRLPEKLRGELQAGKRKAEQALRRQSTGASEQMSYFLVEFMGTHEFIWVKESDIIENFDPEDDPNRQVAAGNVTKKKRSSRSNDVSGSKTFAAALEEGRWALDEFEMQLVDSCGDLVEEEEDEEQDMNYSYVVLCQSDDEADAVDVDSDTDDGEGMTMSDVEESNELLATEGLLDFTAEGRKNAKKRAAARKKKKVDDEKAAMKKEKSEQAKKAKQSKSEKPTKPDKKKKVHKSSIDVKEPAKPDREKEKDDKKEQRELDRKRKKRAREREKALKDELRKKKRKRDSSPDSQELKRSKSVQGGKRNGIADKRGRATAIVKRYLMRMSKNEDMKSLGLSGVFAMPTSTVDSSGLLGMALAFRAAAGELNMPDSSDPRPKPWDIIDVNGPRKSEDRVLNLEKQARLIEDEILRIRSAAQQRRELMDVAVKKREQIEKEIIESDRKARKTHVPKRKKSIKPELKTDEVTGTEQSAATQDDRLSHEVGAKQTADSSPHSTADASKDSHRHKKVPRIDFGEGQAISETAAEEETAKSDARSTVDTDSD